MFLTGTTFLFRQNCFPHGVFVRTASLEENTLHADRRCVVPVKERRVNLDSVDFSRRHAELDDHPVGRGRVVPTRLPPIVPSTRFHKFTGLPDRGRGVDEVAGFGKELVGEGEDFAAEGGAYQVCWLLRSARELGHVPHLG
jgi:hypothetical protein